MLGIDRTELLELFLDLGFRRTCLQLKVCIIVPRKICLHHDDKFLQRRRPQGDAEHHSNLGSHSLALLSSGLEISKSKSAELETEGSAHGCNEMVVCVERRRELCGWLIWQH